MDSSIAPSVEEATAAMDLSEGDSAGAAAAAGENKEGSTLNPASAVEQPSPGEDGTPIDEDDSTTDDDAMPDLDDKEDKAISPEQADILLIKATGLKEEGNTEFKNGDLEKASRAYRRGVNALKKLNLNNSGDEQVKALLVTLYTNLSTVSFKNNKVRVSVDVATHALNIESTNVKALFRRAVAHRKLGSLESARTDLRAALVVDANNVACKKELAAVKKELETAKEQQKKALAKAFDKSGGSFLYNDMEVAAKKKEEEERLKKVQEEEQLKQRKIQWEDECVQLMAKNEPAISFDDWDKKRKERQDEEQKAQEQEAATRRKLERKAAKERAKENIADNDDDDDELTEAELAMMRGYKKTADGRTTSYFTRELSEDEKQRLGDIAPKRLDEQSVSFDCLTTPNGLSQSSDMSATPSATTTAAGAAVGTTTTASAWNQAGTWEEKDTTEWCKTRLRERLETAQTTTEAGADNGGSSMTTVKITAVKELTGDASVAVVSGKKRYIFDFHVKLKYEVLVTPTQQPADGATDDGQDVDMADAQQAKAKVVASGVVRLPDICSTHHDELEVVYDGWTKRPKSGLAEEHALAGRTALADHLRLVIVPSFVQDFNEAY